MPDDVPLAEPPRSVSATATDAWLRRYVLWDVYYALVLVITVGFVVSDDRETVVSKALATGLLLALAAFYTGYARPLVLRDEEGRPGLLYLAGALVLFGFAVILVPAASFALFALSPQAFWLQPVGPGAVAVVVFNAVPVAVNVVRGVELGGQLPITAMIIALSLVFGVWAHRIISQSVDRAALIQELEASRAEVARLSREAGAAAERERLAGEIHDTLAQGFISVVTLVQAAESELAGEPAKARRHLELAARTARENLAEARSLVAALGPVPLASSSLEEAVGRLVQRLGDELEIRAAYATEGEARRLAAGVEVVLLRATQEALANVRRHAQAGEVRVRLAYGQSCVRLEVTDDGTGFRAAPDSSGGFGLRAMRSRVEQVGGTLSLAGEVGGGATVTVEVPG